MDKQNAKREVWALDLDATVAHYEEGDIDRNGVEYIGPPVPEMVETIRQALHDGIEVFIFTARVTPFDESFEEQLNATRSYGLILDWCREHIGYPLPVTNQKLRCFTRFIDDRGAQVVPNTGIFATDLMAGAHGASGDTDDASTERESQNQAAPQPR